MSSFSFILIIGLMGLGIYYYAKRKVSTKEKEFNDFAMKMQKDFLENSPALHKGVDYQKIVHDFYTSKGYSLSKHSDFTSDLIAKRDNEIVFIRIQGPESKKDITAEVLQHFIGQTVLSILDDKSHTISWIYVCSKMMCDRSAKVLLKKYETKLQFELIEAVEPQKAQEV